MPSVLNQWLADLPLMQQSVLISCLRGPDGLPKNNPGKNIIRCLRQIICVDAKPLDQHSYMNANQELIDLYVFDFLKDIDIYPLHFFLHLIYAIEIIGYKHPSEKIRKKYESIYLLIVNTIHFNPETKESLDKRLNF